MELLNILTVQAELLKVALSDRVCLFSASFGTNLFLEDRASERHVVVDERGTKHRTAVFVLKLQFKFSNILNKKTDASRQMCLNARRFELMFRSFYQKTFSKRTLLFEQLFRHSASLMSLYVVLSPAVSCVLSMTKNAEALFSQIAESQII